jgi:dTDP-glucose pyrophosphorylase
VKILLTKEHTFKDLVEKLDHYGIGFLAIVDANDILIGILTDGDVRRAILNDVQDVESIFNKEPVTVLEGTPRKKIISILKYIRRKHMPVINLDGKLIEIVTFDDIDFNHKVNKVVIMAGGLGARLGDLTRNTPKPMLHVGDRPMLVHIIEAFQHFGYTDFTICVNYKSEQIKDYFKNGSSFGVNIDYIEERKRLGTAGALSLVKTLKSDPFFVINGDVLTTLNFEKLMDFHISSRASATMCVRDYEMKMPYGAVNADSNGNILDLREKPISKFLINSGVYVLNPSVLSEIPFGEYFDMPSLFEKIITKSFDTKIYQVTDYWIDIGSQSDLILANEDLVDSNL